MEEKQLNLIYEFDDLMKCTRVLWEHSCAEDFLKYVIHQENLRLQYDEILVECKRLKEALDEAVRNNSKLEMKVKKGRNLLDVQKEESRKLGRERDAMANVLEEVRRILCNDSHCKLPEETKNKLTVITSTGGFGRNSEHYTANSQTDLESSISLTRSEDDLDESRMSRSKRTLVSVGEEPYSMPKKRSSIYPPLAPLASKPESLNSTESDENRFSVFDCLNRRVHRFENSSIKIGAECFSCGRKIRLRAALRCSICTAFTHIECRTNVPLPCVPLNIPIKSGVVGNISDYAPKTPPCIPAIIYHCIYEVERRGLQEKGIYRISGDHREVQQLKEKFFKSKGLPNLTNTEIHSVCSFLKEFLRSLNDSLIPKSEWTTFAETTSSDDKINALSQAVSSLPRANRDTLAFLILHLQRVSQTPACHMTVYNLATVFGPTVIGYYDPANPLAETEITNRVMEDLLSLSTEFWSNFLDEPMPLPATPVCHAPSKESYKKKYFSRW